MSTSGASIPSLVSAFAFGIVVNAASAALFLFVSGHGTSLFRDGQRLVLATFLSSAALWAQIDFISIAINTDAAMSCQIGIIFHTFFDQLGRFSIEQFLLWAINRDSGKTGAQVMIPQVLLAARFVLGAVFVGFSRPVFAPVCVPLSSMLPLAIVVVALDAVIIAMLAVLAFSAGLVTEVRAGRSGSGRSKSILLVIVAFAVWTGTSVTMLLGMSNIDLLWKTLVPSIGLLIIIFVVTACNEPLTKPKPRAARPPESPGVRDISTGLSTTTDASTDYPPSRYEDLKRVEVLPGSAFERPRHAPTPGIPGVPPIPPALLARSTARETGLFLASAAAAVAAAGEEEQQQQAQIPNRSVTDPTPRRGASKAKRSLLDLKGGPAAGRIAISHPILESNGEQNPLNKIATISLEDAAKNERERRQNELHRDSALIAKRPAPQPPSLSPEEGLMRAVSLKRKEVASVSPHPSMPSAAGMEAMPPVAVTSSSQLSPGTETIRRRSPRQSPADADGRRSMAAANAAPVPATLSPTIPLPAPAQQQQQQVFRQKSTRDAPIPAQTAAAAGTEAGVPRPNIRPSRRLAEPTTTAPAPEPPKTALQRRPTIGLPGNPRAMAIRQAAEAADAAAASKKQQHQTIMFMNNIVYDNPEAVQSIIDDVSLKEGLKGGDFRTSGSVVHRPRPIPRKPEEDRALFPAAPSPNLASLVGHRRSKSGSAIVGRKSLLMQSHPGSPTQLPPLPPHPRHLLAQQQQQQQRQQQQQQQQPQQQQYPHHHIDRPNALRPHPNDTKSMTFHEKMTLLFPSPPSGDAISKQQRRRSSSVPELPRMSKDYAPMDYMPITVSPTASRMSHSTTKSPRASIRTENVLEILEVDELPSRDARRAEEAAARQRSLADEVVGGGSWLGGASSRPSMRSSGQDTGGGKRASSPVLPPPQVPGRESTFTTTSDARSTTNWGSVHSPVTAVPIQSKAARSMYIGGAPREGAPPDSHGDSHMLQKAGEASPSSRDPHRESQWHRRVGDNCPTFSDRKEKMRSRKMPPPTPLLLGAVVSTRNPGVVAKAAQPSPLESPTKALAFIQAQLRKFESPTNRSTTTASPGQRLALLENLEKEMDVQVDHWHDLQHDLGRDSMSSMQTATPRIEQAQEATPVDAQQIQKESSSSLSQVEAASPVAEVQQDMRKLSIGADRRAARLSRIRGETADSAKPAATGGWQKRLAEAQTEFVEGSSRLGIEQPAKGNFLDLSHMGSPTPPDSDDSDNEQPVHRPQSIAAAVALATATPEQSPKATEDSNKQLLWTPGNGLARTPAKPMLWTASAPKTPRAAVGEEPAVDYNRHKRSDSDKKAIDDAPLQIQSTSLWSMDGAGQKKQAGAGLWSAPKARQPSPPAAEIPLVPATNQSVSTTPELHPELMEELELDLDALEPETHSHASQRPPRPLTQKPPRRSRRVTMLPDILESPEPMPDKRGTLGIFQFPWGEKSDTATIQPLPQPRSAATTATLMAMPGTMTSGGNNQAVQAALEARSRQLEASEYSSSFFDDYDDEDELDAEVPDSDEDRSDSDDDDAFDENTLWEIASLLKTEQVPSKMSLLPPPLSASSSNFGDYMSDMDADEGQYDDDDEENLRADEEAIMDEIAEILVGIEDTSNNNSGRTRDLLVSKLWASRKATRDTRDTREKTISVADPDEQTWKNYDRIKQAATLRSKPRKSKPATVESSELWSHRAATRSTDASSQKTASQLLWAGPARKNSQKATHASKTPEKATEKTAPLWAPRKKTPMTFGKARKVALFDKEAAEADKMHTVVVRTTDQEPAALHMARTPRTPSNEPLPRLQSTNLWRGKMGLASGPQLWAPMPVPKKVRSSMKTSHLFDRDEAAIQKLRMHRIRTTDKEPAALRMSRTPRAPSQEPLPKLQSTNLWTGRTSPTRPQQLWAPRPVPRVSRSAKKSHLFDRDEAAIQKLRAHRVRTTDKEPAALHMVRTPRTPSKEPLPKLQSTNLWTGRTSPTKPQQLWTPMPVPRLNRSAKKSHLFDRDEAAMQKLRTHRVRTTDKEPAALRMPRTPRVPSKEPLPQLQSTSLWAGKTGPTKKQQLWAPRPVRHVKPKTTSQLFDRDVAALEKLHAHVRTTDQEPVSAHVARVVPRSQAHLPDLAVTSTKLWTIVEEAVAGEGRNWIVAGGQHEKAVAAMEENTVSDVSVSDSDDTILSSSTGKQPPTWWEKMKAKAGIAMSPTTTTAAAAAAKIKEAEASVDRARMSGESERSEQDAQQSSSPRSLTSEETLQQSSPTARSPVRSARPINTTPDDWNVALREAVAASYPPLPRMVASPAQWKDALEEALARSYPFDAAKSHPVFAGAAPLGLTDSASLVADVSKVHPAFFSSASVLPATPVQPAPPVDRALASFQDASPVLLSPAVYTPDAAMMAQIEALEREREFAAMAAQQFVAAQAAYAVPEPEVTYVPEVYVPEAYAPVAYAPQVVEQPFEGRLVPEVPATEPYVPEQIYLQPMEYVPEQYVPEQLEQGTYGQRVQLIQAEPAGSVDNVQPQEVQVFVQEPAQPESPESPVVPVAPVPVRVQTPRLEQETNRLSAGSANSDNLLAAPPSPMPRARTPEQEAAYQTYMMSMQNSALARLQAMEGPQY